MRVRSCLRVFPAFRVGKRCNLFFFKFAWIWRVLGWPDQPAAGGRRAEGGVPGGLALCRHRQPDIRLQRLEPRRHPANHRLCRPQPGSLRNSSSSSPKRKNWIFIMSQCLKVLGYNACHANRQGTSTVYPKCRWHKGYLYFYSVGC